jgi:uncharacterized membrane protein YdjX (TVP38/TMEM64 family)
MSERWAPLRRWTWFALGLTLAVLLAVLIKWGQPLYRFAVDQEQIRVRIKGLGGWGPVAIAVLEMIQALLAPIPGQAIEAVSGYLYGPLLGTLYALAGMAVGSLMLFLLARRFGRPLAIRLIGKQSMARLDDLVRRGGAPFFFLIWLLPFAPDDLACLAAGLTPMPTRQFVFLMFLGRLPGVLVSVWVGANATRLSATVWAVLFAAIALVALLLWRWGEQIQESVLRFIERSLDRLRR